MFTCSFRSIVHQSSRFRPSFVAAPAASISTSVIRRNQPPADRPFDAMFKALEDQANKTEDSPPRFAAPADGQAASYGTYKEKLRGFRRNMPLHPKEFSRAKRVEVRQRQPKRWDLGLPTRKARYNDIFYQLGIDPVDECMNPSLLSHFVTKMGRVERRAETELTMRSQRRVAKAIKRAKMMGIMPTHSKTFGLYKFPK